MSRTRKGNKSPGEDFWSRRNFGYGSAGYGKIRKTITKRKKRRKDRLMEHKILKDPEDYEKRFPGE